MRLQKGQLFVLKCDVTEADVVTRLVHTLEKGTTGAIVNRDVDFDGIVLAHFIDEFWGNIIIHVQTDDIQPISANFARAPRRVWKDVS